MAPAAKGNKAPVPAASAPSQKRNKTSGQSSSSFEKSGNSAADAFALTVLEPDKNLHRFPGNLFPTSVAPAVINVAAQSVYDSSWSANVYLSDDSITPVCITNGAAASWNGGTFPGMSVITRPQATGQHQWVSSPGFINEKYALFSSKVSCKNGISFVGYRTSNGGAPQPVTLTVPNGMLGSVTFYRRDGVDDGFTSTSVIGPGTTSITHNLAVGTTAWGVSIECDVPASGNYLVVLAAQTASVDLTIGNHATFTKRLPIPDFAEMKATRVRTTGIKAHLRYLGDDFHNGGSLAGAQFSPDIDPSLCPGNTTQEQILSSNVPGIHRGHFKTGCVARFVGPNPEHYSLLSGPRRFGVSGYTVISWTTDPTAPQPYTLSVSLALEFVSTVVQFQKQLPQYASPDKLAATIDLLNRIQTITENPLHDLVLALWHKVSHGAKRVLSSPKTWYTIAEVAGGVAASLL